MKPQKTAAYIWFDAEFTSLELDDAHLMQVAVILTDSSLHRIVPADADLNLSIRLDASAEVSPWVAENLPDLVEKCRSGADSVSVEEADRQIAALLDQYCDTPFEKISDRPILAGNSVHNDWFLMRKFLPMFGSRLHYRLLDVSSFKTQWQDGFEQTPFDKENVELLKQYFPTIGISSAQAHDALFDVKASIAEYAFYCAHLKIMD